MAKKKNCNNIRRSRGGKRSFGISRFSDDGVKRLSTGKKKKKNKLSSNFASPSTPNRSDFIEKSTAVSTPLPKNNAKRTSATGPPKKRKRKYCSKILTPSKSVSNSEPIEENPLATLNSSHVNSSASQITSVVDNDSVPAVKSKTSVVDDGLAPTITSEKSIVDNESVSETSQSSGEKTLVIDETIPATPEKAVTTNETIDLVASDDENMDTPDTSTKLRQCRFKNNSIVIDITDTSIVSDDIIIDHISPPKKRSRRMLEVENNNSVDKNEEDKDDIIILHSNCKDVEEIQFIEQIHNVPESNVLTLTKGPKKKTAERPVLNTSVEGCNKNEGKGHFNASFYNPYNKHKRKSGNNAIRKNIENMVKKNFKNNPKLLLDSLPPKAKLSAIGGNVYSENPVVIPTFGLRPIIIDGSNVAFHHSRNRQFSCKGLEICINYFKEKGHKVTAFVPQFRVKGNKCDNPKLLEKLVNQGDVILTPSRMVDGKPMNSYDDRYIVQFAAAKGGVIVTRDNYADLLKENPAWEETIKYRLLQFTWADDLLMFPNDPLGCRGPNLEKFLRFS